MTSLACALLACLAQQAPVASAPTPERARLEKEIAEVDATIGPGRNHAEPGSVTRRGKLYFRLARLVQAGGQDPAEFYRKAIDDLTLTRYEAGGGDEAALYLGFAFLCYGESERSR